MGYLVEQKIGRGGVSRPYQTAAEYLEDHPYCLYCQNKGIFPGEMATHLTMSMEHKPVPTCDTHYMQVCLFFGRTLEIGMANANLNDWIFTNRRWT